MPTETNKVWKSVAAGAVGGLVASFAMNRFQSIISAISESMATKERERKNEPEPKPKQEGEGDDATVEAAKAISAVIFNHELTEAEKKWAGPAVHYSLGTALGAIYGSLAQHSPVELGAGTGFGAAVWLIADEIAVPSLGLSGPPSETPLPGHAKALASHLVFGVVTYAIRKLMLA